MPRSSTENAAKTNRLSLFLHTGNLEPHHAEQILAENLAVDAAYIISSDSTAVHYVNRLNPTPSPLSVNDKESVRKLIKALNCQPKFHQKQPCLVPDLQVNHLQFISSQLNHQHKFNVIERVASAFKKLEKEKDFCSRNKSLYLEAVNAYQAFVVESLEPAFDQLKIHLGYQFYNNKDFTLATLDNSLYMKLRGREIMSETQEIAQAKARGETPDSLMIRLAHFISGNTGETAQQVQSKLAKGSEVAANLISKDFSSILIKGIHKLDFVLSSSQIPTSWPELVDYHHELRPGTNACVDFLLQLIAKAVGLDSEKIKHDLQMNGTQRQQVLLNQLRQECEQYRSYLQKKLHIALPEESVSSNSKLQSEKTPLLGCQKKYAEKYRIINELTNVLSNPSLNAVKKISEFKRKFADSKSALADHADGAGILFLKRAGYLLASFFLGAGLIYSYKQNGTCNFFKEKDEKITEEIGRSLGISL